MTLPKEYHVKTTQSSSMLEIRDGVPANRNFCKEHFNPWKHEKVNLRCHLQDIFLQNSFFCHESFAMFCEKQRPLSPLFYGLRLGVPIKIPPVFGEKKMRKRENWQCPIFARTPFMDSLEWPGNFTSPVSKHIFHSFWHTSMQKR